MLIKRLVEQARPPDHIRLRSEFLLRRQRSLQYGRIRLGPFGEAGKQTSMNTKLTRNKQTNQ